MGARAIIPSCLSVHDQCCRRRRQAVVGVCIVLVERERTSSISLYDIGTAKVIHMN